MSNYPAKVAVLAPEFVIVEGKEHSDDLCRYVFLTAFAILKVERRGRGFHFEEVRQLDDTGNAGADLLEALANEIDGGHEPCRLPPRPHSCRPGPGAARRRTQRPMQAFLEAAAGGARERLQDAARFDRNRHLSLEQLASDFDLAAEWHRPSRQGNPNKLEQELSAKAQSIWLAIAHEWLVRDELRRALADYDQWRTAKSIA